MADTILIVEDWEDDAKLLEQTLLQLGVRNPLIFLTSASDAVLYFEGKFPYSDREKYPLPKIIFLDLKLPGTDGFEFLEWLKSTHRLNNQTIFAISGVDDLASIRRAYSMGASSFVPKPPKSLDLENLMISFPMGWVTAGAPRPPESSGPARPIAPIPPTPPTPPTPPSPP